MAAEPGYIISPTGQIVPGGLRDMGIGINAIPTNVPDVATVQDDAAAAQLPAPEMALPPAARAAIPPPAEAPYGADFPQLGLPSELANFLETGKLPPRREPLQTGRPFVTELPPDQEVAFQAWAKKNRVPWRDEKAADYDMRGYWSALQAGDPRATTGAGTDGALHYPDTWKTPYHKTFSDESVYAAGRAAPTWRGNVLVAPDGTVVADERTPAEKRAASQAPTTASPTRGAPAPAARQPSLADVPGMLDRTTAARGEAALVEGGVAQQQADDVYAARQRADDVVEEGLLELQAEAERDQVVRLQKTADYEAAEKEADNFKIDRNRFWAKADTGKKIAWGIAMALSGLGDALQGKSGPNPVIQMIQDAIKEDVAAQMDQRDALRQKVGRKEKAIDNFDRFSSNKTAQTLQRLGIGTKLVEQMIVTAGARMAGTAAQARAASTAAELAQQGTLLKGQAIGAAAQDERQREQTATQREQIAASERNSIRDERLGYANIAGQDRRHAEDIALAERKRRDEFEFSLGKSSAEQQKAMLELQKDASERGLNDPSTGRPILKPEGVKLVKEAERLDALAEEAKDPAEAQALADKAKLLRSRADLYELVKTAPTTAAKINAKISGFQSAIAITEDIAALRRKHGPKWATTTEGVQAMTSLGRTLDMMLKQGFEMGALDRGSLQAAMEMRGGDPTKVTVGDISTWLGAKGTEAALDTLADSLEKLGYSELGSAGVRDAGNKDVFKFRRSTDSVKKELDERLSALKDKTPGEFDAGMSANARYQLQGKSPAEQRALVDQLSQTTGGGEFKGRPVPSSTYPGLSSTQEVAVDRLLDTATASPDGVDDPIARKKLRSDAAQARIAIVDATTAAWRGRNQRPELVNGMLRALNARSPDIYKEVLARAPSNDLVSFAQNGDPVAREVLLARPDKDLTVAAREYVERAKAPPQLPSVNVGGVSADVAVLPDDVLRQMAGRGDQEAQRELVNRRRANRAVEDRPPSMALE